ncbi:MAG TPA: glucose-6-phosphate isomerase [Candidatus Omnitrophica bacterium]|nr:MAG: glucose-6-phosphate isomerase [Omnitrophica WOR_2 bacterium GWA2_45_18]HBR14420.1 glucose-6-phosphate isomerase [Candidatus Omnitrophota bacterium]
MDIKLDREYLKGFITQNDYKNLMPAIEKAHRDLENRTGKGAEFTGWLDLPRKMEDAVLDELTAFGQEIRDHADCLLSIGIGGSYVGIHASLEFLISDQKLPVYFAGHNLSSGYLYHLLNTLKDKRLTVVVISKSGTTTEPALAFRIIKQFMKEKYMPEELKKRIICITDPKKGALRSIANKEGYRTFPINDDVGGRFSVLTPAGLVPLAIAGIDVKGLIQGARKAQDQCSMMDLSKNIAYQYAAARYLLYTQGKTIEVLSTFYQRMSLVEEWWKQLFGESEGKDGKGVFPTSLSFTTDLHSMGQLIQEGQRNIFETFLIAEDSGHECIIPYDEDNVDAFNCVAGKDLDYVNKQAYKATAMAHFEGGVPNMTITIPRFDARTLGQLYYFFEKAVAIKGYLLGVNPFDQPGVEAYKNKMFALLGR